MRILNDLTAVGIGVAIGVFGAMEMGGMTFLSCGIAAAFIAARYLEEGI